MNNFRRLGKWMKALSGPLPRLIAALVMFFAVVIGEPAPNAMACSGDGVPNPDVRFAPSADTSQPEPSLMPGGGRLVVLGEVVSERSVASTPFFPSLKSYVSDVQVVLTLSGQADSQPLLVGPHGYGAPDCSGGPRLLPGEKVMLFLYQTLEVYKRERDGPLIGGNWQAGQFGAPILFDGPSAYYLSWSRYSSQGDGIGVDHRLFVGESARVLDLALVAFHASAEERNTAFEFVLGAPDPYSPPAPSLSPPLVGDAGLLTAR